ncbi:acyltransferase [Megasphaera paucivorans]|uniref:Membrane-bound acyltransferase YfiQ, involved in biofilm formation n=1 Tax=Megasphaera paucivorans TaxID=349095 RepID=A0A1G9PXU1_9FIRM|nr:acyltransferase [Megasphaera paucivorans]SDM03599.1 Membrane-bound acyltransferase YfiQ, involved in biofilm formation [Megasphaera paucivorans]
MSKRFINSINYMRGICMLGVIGIHVGSIALTNPAPNLGLVSILEILTRFSVPAFFFLSAFGMFYSEPLSKPFSYSTYLRRRLKTVLIPYVTWSFFYMLYSAALSHNGMIFEPGNIVKTLWYGLAMYHIYFLVILLWFYVLMPIWRPMLRFMDHKPWFWFPLLFIVNAVFNFYSSYIWDFHFSSSLLQDAFNFRLNYVIFHYLFIFMFGAYTAEHFDDVKNWLSHHGVFINILQILSTAGILMSFYGVMKYLHYDALSAVYTVHQLSPTGMLYTVSTMLFLLYWWECRPVPQKVHFLLNMLGNYSYPIYLVHPVFLSMLTGIAAHLHIYLRSLHIIIIYCIVTLCAILFSALLPKLHLPKWMYVCIKGK